MAANSGYVCRGCIRKLTGGHSTFLGLRRYTSFAYHDATLHALKSGSKTTSQRKFSVISASRDTQQDNKDEEEIVDALSAERPTGRIRPGGRRRIRAGTARPTPKTPEVQELVSSLASDMPRSPRRRRSNDVIEDLVPSPPSAPLGSKPTPKPEPAPVTSPTPPTSPLKHHPNAPEDFNWYWESYPPTPSQKASANHFFTTHGPRAKLLRSVAQFRLFPASDVPEVAFIGRSNVGKSSLLNALVNSDIKTLLARTSATPGFTKTMNLYGVGAGNGVTIKQQPDGRDKVVGFQGVTIVDMPGYGEGSLSSWGVEIMKYIQSRKQLRRVFVLVDAQHGIKDKDRSVLASLRLAGVSHQVVLSKLDKLYIPKAKEIKRFDGKVMQKLKAKGTVEALRKNMEGLKNEIKPPVGGGALGEILGVSAETLVDGRRLGIDHVRFAVLKAAGLDAGLKKR